MADTSFRPFDTHIDHETALRHLRAATDGADDGELFLERARSEVMVFDDGRLRNASFDATEGFGLRALRGAATGYAHASDITEAALLRAADTARLAVGAGGGTMAPAPKPTNTRLYTDADPITGVDFAMKRDVLREIDAFARDLDARVVQVSAVIMASHQEVEILRPEGTHLRDVRPMARLNVSVIVEDNGRREQGTSGGGGRIGLDGLLDAKAWQAQVNEALRIALVNLSAVAAPAGVMDVAPTGNGRRQSHAHAPMPRMTNTYMLGGDVAPGDIVADLKDGIHAVGFGGGQVDITSGKFVFSCTEAYRVKDGRVGEPVKGATLIGDGATALRQIRALGNDMALDPGMGNCGKQGQWVPVGVGQPTVMIGGLTVGGSA